MISWAREPARPKRSYKDGAIVMCAVRKVTIAAMPIGGAKIATSAYRSRQRMAAMNPSLRRPRRIAACHKTIAVDRIAIWAMSAARATICRHEASAISLNFSPFAERKHREDLIGAQAI